MQSKEKQRALVVGAGSFGTASALNLARNGCEVLLWTRNEECVHSINTTRHNNRYLSSVELPESIQAFSDPRQIDRFGELAIVLWAIPTQSIRSVARLFSELNSEKALIVSLAKGFERETMKLPSAVLREHFPRAKILALSGPSFASEIARGQPTGVALAGDDHPSLAKAQTLLHSPLFRVYTHTDLIGLEIAGALKNVIALAAGAGNALGYAHNARATLLTRALAEMVRIGRHFGARPITFNGLAGVGDLFLTCSSEQSRNFQAGYRLGRGESPEIVMSTLSGTAEGIATSHAVYHICQQNNLRAPLVTAVYQVLWQNLPIKEAVFRLTHAQAQAEFDYENA